MGSLSNNGVQNTTWLTDDQCETIVLATLEVLAETGCEVRSTVARNLLVDAGALVAGERVRIPADLVRQAIASAPKSVTLYTREGSVAFDLDPASPEIHFAPGIANQYRIDVVDGKRRVTTKQDAADAAIIVDGLHHIDMACGLCSITDCAPALQPVWEARMLMEHTSKPFMMYNFDLESVEHNLRLGATVKGSVEAFVNNPFVLLSETAQSPLVHNEESLAKLLRISEIGLPITYIGAPALGSTGPMTVAGSFVITLADCFVGLVLNQLVRPGNPFVACAFVDVMDMRSMGFCMGAPEFARNSAATADLFRYLGLPYVAHLGATDSPVFDQQAVADLTVQLQAAVQAGVNLSWFIGYLESGMASSLEALLFGDEIIGYLKHMTQPIVVVSDTLALESIASVGPGGNFLMEEHTLDHYTENYTPTDFVRSGFDAWQGAGSQDLGIRLAQKAQSLLAQGSAHRLDNETTTKLDAIMIALEDGLA